MDRQIRLTSEQAFQRKCSRPLGVHAMAVPRFPVADQSDERDVDDCREAFSVNNAFAGVNSAGAGIARG
jgi:hypothetical protein